MTLKYQDREHKINVVASHTYGIYDTINNQESEIGKFALLFTNKLVSLWGFEIYPEHQRKGYALKVLLAVANKLREQGRHTLALYVKPNNHGAIKLYEKIGFKQIEQADSFSLYYELDLCKVTIGNLPHFIECKEVEL